MNELKPAVYVISEVAFLLQTSEWNVYELIKRDEIPGVFMLGTQYRFLRSVFNKAFAINVPVNPPEEANCINGRDAE